MKKKKKLIQQNKSYADYLGMGILGGLMAFAVSSAVVQYIDLDPWMMFSYMRIIISVFFTMSICILMFRNWKTMAVGGALILTAVIVLSIIWFREGFSEEVYIGVAEYFQWLRGFIFSWHESMKLPWTYTYITISGISALITVMMYFLIVKWFIYIPVFVITVSLFVTQWAIVREVNKIAFYLAFALLVILYALTVFRDSIKRIIKRGEGQKLMSTGRLIAAVSPVVAILLIIVLIIPKSNDPIIWDWLDDKIKYRNTGGDKPVDYQTYDEFSVTESGFSSEPGVPGGSVTLDYTHVLDVYSDRMVYLRGESWPYFNGTAWTGSSETENYSEPVLEYDKYNPDRMMFLEPVYGWRFMELNDWFLNDFAEFEGRKILPGDGFETVTGDHLLPEWYERSEVSIVYAGVETKSLFSPLYSTLVNFGGLSDVFAETDDTLETEKPVRLLTGVDFEYLAMDDGNEALLEALRNSRRGIYSQLYSGLTYIINNSNDGAFSTLMLTSTLYDAMEDLYDLYIVSEDYYWRYTAVSDTLTDRVKMLAESIVEPYDNDYDRVKAIDEFFNDDFTYSLQVDDVPQNRDFVDWFLFGPREGYCTYYATAMTTMVRSIGLPARYVEGFLTPRYPEPFYRYPILNANAHAWVEVYFEGVGWITFDPTPSGSERGYNNTDDEPDRVLDDEVLDENLDELDKPDDPFVPLPPSGTTDDKGSSIPKGLLIPLIIVGALAIFNILVHILRKSLFKRVASSRKFKIGYLEILRIARLRGFKLRKGRTLMELAEMIDDAYFAAHVSMKDITSVYYKIVYNGDDTTPEELKKIELFYTDFRHELNNELKLWEWIVYRILLPIL